MFASQMSDTAFNELYRQLQNLMGESAERQYQAKLALAKTEKQRRRCAGGYPSAYSRLMNLWSRDKIPTSLVDEYLELDEATIDARLQHIQ